MALNHSPQIITNGLVLYLDAANKKSYPGSGTTWFDLSGNSNNLTLINSPTHSSSTGRFSFNASSQQYATMNSNVSITMSQPTIIVGCSVGTGTVLAKGAFGSYWNYGLVDITSTTFRLRNNSGDTVSSTMESVSGMNVFGGVWNGTVMQFYRNGVYRGESTGNYGPVSTNSQVLRIGNAYRSSPTPGDTGFYTGDIAYVMVYNRALSAAEVAQNFNALRGRFGI